MANYSNCKVWNQSDLAHPSLTPAHSPPFSTLLCSPEGWYLWVTSPRDPLFSGFPLVSADRRHQQGDVRKGEKRIVYPAPLLLLTEFTSDNWISLQQLVPEEWWNKIKCWMAIEKGGRGRESTSNWQHGQRGTLV